MDSTPVVAPDLARKLGLVDALAIVVGIVIGGGIFLVPNLVARELKSTTMILAVWVFAGVISFFGSLACAELGTAIPATGNGEQRTAAPCSNRPRRPHFPASQVID